MGARLLEPEEIGRLVARARDGERAAWDELVSGLAGVVWAVVRSHRLDRADGEDVAQGVWLRLAQHLGRLEHPERLPGWLATTTRRECLLVLRRAARADEQVRRVSAQPEGPGEPDPSASLEDAERRRAVRAGLDALDDRCRELLTWAAHVPPLSYADLSEALGIPVSAIGPTRSRCLEKLRRQRDVRRLLEQP